MEHLDNDMDDLFQKAGELYPLKISGSDWETVAAKLQDQNFEDLNAVTGLSANGTGNKRRWRLLLLLIPLGLAGLVFTTGKLNRHPGSSETNTSKINPAGRAEEIKSNPAVNEEQTNSAPVKPSTENKTIKEDKKLNSERPGQPAYAKSKTGDVKNLDRTRNPVAFDNRDQLRDLDQDEDGYPLRTLQGRGVPGDAANRRGLTAADPWDDEHRRGPMILPA